MDHPLSRRIALIFLLCCLALSPSSAGASGGPLAAFPGAEGYGSLATGGRFGRVLVVENLEGAGEAGSFGRAIEDHNSGAGCPGVGMGETCPSTIVFDTSGWIELEEFFTVTAPGLTIAGQTAPLPGIGLRAKPGDDDLQGALLRVAADDVVVRHVRIRPGVGSHPDGSSFKGVSIVAPAEHVILDHVSITWAEDEGLTIFKEARHITVQHSLLGEILGCANHEKTIRPGQPTCSGVYCCEELVDAGLPGEPHSRLITITTQNDETPSPTNISFHRNLMASSNRRFPNVSSRTHVKFTNNIVHNFGVFGSQIHAGKDPDDHYTELDYVANYLRTGPWTEQFVARTGGAERYLITSALPEPAVAHPIYEADNHLDSATPGVAAIRDPDVEADDLVEWLLDWNANVDDEPIPVTLDLNPDPSVLGKVLSTSGAFPRDSADMRIVTETHCGWGAIVDDPVAEVGWPVLAVNERAAGWDSDGDGLPDYWENLLVHQHLDPSDGTDGSKEEPGGSGYTNLEVYINDQAALLLVDPPTPSSCDDVEAPTIPQWRGNPRVVGPNDISLDWYDSKDRDGIVYLVEERTAGSSWEVLVSGLELSEHLETGLLPDTLYQFRLEAEDLTGNESAASGIRNVLTPMVVIEDFELNPKGSQQIIQLSWSEHPNLDVDHYEIQRDGAFLADVPADPGSSQDAIYVDATASCSGHTYEVHAVDDTVGSENESWPVSRTIAAVWCNES